MRLEIKNRDIRPKIDNRTVGRNIMVRQKIEAGRRRTSKMPRRIQLAFRNTSDEHVYCRLLIQFASTTNYTDCPITKLKSTDICTYHLYKSSLEWKHTQHVHTTKIAHLVYSLRQKLDQ